MSESESMNNREIVRMFKILGNERRFLILRYLFHNKELAVGQISGLIKLSFRSTSKHLTVLMNMDLLDSKQVSSNKFYSINYSKFPKEFTKFFVG